MTVQNPILQEIKKLGIEDKLYLIRYLTESIQRDDELPSFIAEKEKQDFNTLIENRMKYIESLRDLPSNWISGESKKPSKPIIQASKDLLSHITGLYFELYPKLLMSPVPEGGTGFTFVKDENNKVFVQLLNTMNYEVEVQQDGHFSETITEPITNHWTEVELAFYKIGIIPSNSKIEGGVQLL